ncbi:hypothetical protein [Sutterella sp.]|uniref:hypothetical protein n=1 Tax=Sutterella sp. TaxID=1981025 RepID=UPI0026E0AC56|nr:hypothetical protein [Sutterella sp.]MDO5532197.1 hypothetical protein [Sutterella sp.]
MKSAVITAAALCAVFLVAGVPQARAAEAVSLEDIMAPEKICVVNSLEKTAGCRKGDIVLFRPDFFGNEQMPVSFAAAVCDFTKTVSLTKGAVACVFAGLRDLYEGEAPEEEEKPEQADSREQ